jgi:hypothetical protein
MGCEGLGAPHTHTSRRSPSFSPSSRFWVFPDGPRVRTRRLWLSSRAGTLTHTHTHIQSVHARHWHTGNGHERLKLLNHSAARVPTACTTKQTSLSPPTDRVHGRSHATHRITRAKNSTSRCNTLRVHRQSLKQAAPALRVCLFVNLCYCFGVSFRCTPHG